MKSQPAAYEVGGENKLKFYKHSQLFAYDYDVWIRTSVYKYHGEEEGKKHRMRERERGSSE